MYQLFNLEHIKPAVKESIRRKKLTAVQAQSPLGRITTRDISGPEVVDNPIEDVLVEKRPKQLPPLKQKFDSDTLSSPSAQSIHKGISQAVSEDFSGLSVSAAKTRVRDPLVVSIQTALGEENLTRKHGKKLFNVDERTDWTRVGYGGSKEDYMTFRYNESMNLIAEPSKTYNDIEDQYSTVSNKYFPKLIYEPSKPATRDILGDALTAANRRKFKREQRYIFSVYIIFFVSFLKIQYG
jgi:hypothetical protein